MLKSNRAFNETWVFTASFGGTFGCGNPSPQKSGMNYLLRYRYLYWLNMDLRNPYDPVCKVSDTSEES
jgi:hypothetical protein